MISGTRARLLEDLIDELVSGVIVATPTGAGLRPVSVEFTLPVEMRLVPVTAASGSASDTPPEVAVRADLPE